MIDHELKTRMCFEESDVIPSKTFNFKNIFYQRIKDHCIILKYNILGKLFNSFVFLKTYIFVAHGTIISLFDVLKGKWIKHLVFDSEIL